MSAIEMMDPKMDAGMIGNQVNRKVLNLEQAIKVQSHFIVIQGEENLNINYMTVMTIFNCKRFIIKCYFIRWCVVGRCHQGERPQSSRTHRNYRHMFLLFGEFIILYH